MSTDVKDTKELIKGATKVGVYFIKAAKDGLGADDAVGFVTKIVSDSDFRKALQDAYEDVSTVGDEVKDLTLSETIELVKLLADSVQELGEARKS